MKATPAPGRYSFASAPGAAPMSWPSQTDFTDALRNPAAAFTDPDLAGGEAVAGPDGSPAPHAGSTSAVYQLCGDDGRIWAVKCFTRPVTELADRYARIRAALDQTPLACALGFTFLEHGL